MAHSTLLSRRYAALSLFAGAALFLPATAYADSTGTLVSSVCDDLGNGQLELLCVYVAGSCTIGQPIDASTTPAGIGLPPASCGDGELVIPITECSTRHEVCALTATINSACSRITSRVAQESVDVDPVCLLGGGGDGDIEPPVPGSGSPIIIDLSGDGFVLTDVANGVRFDITGTGHPVRMAWTSANADNAFLALDRNGNGRIDDGTELFGNYSPQPASKTPNGFLALGVYDLPQNGGNGDGFIDQRDAIFESLRLWVDVSHDGVSQPAELYALPSMGVYSLGLRYHVSARRDAFGNQFRYRAKVNPMHRSDDSEVGPSAYDVFFVID